MYQLLKLKQTVQLSQHNTPCIVEQFLGGGGQGEVYNATLNGKAVALKWYFAEQATQEQQQSIEELIKKGAPTANFLWPIDIATAKGTKGFGYIMPLREARYKSLFDLMKRRAEPTFSALITAAYQLAENFYQLHGKGLCYRDISHGNIFFDPQTGEILICDNDNVSVNGTDKTGVYGTPRFMAPEIVRAETKPNTQTDLFSLAVLLFYMLMMHHPLEGKKESDIKCFDLPAMNKLYGFEPVFIFDPQNNSNQPVVGYHDNALIYWPLYPQFLRDLFIKAFTDGLNNTNNRIRESEWRFALIRLRDSIVYCQHCHSENFADAQQNQTQKICWNCQKPFSLPVKLSVNNQVIMLNANTQLFAHHLDPNRKYDFTQPLAIMQQHPQNPNIWGLKNLSTTWQITTADGTVKVVEPQRSVALNLGTIINFGVVEGHFV